MRCSSTQTGFTLIEMLVTVGIMLLAIGAGLASLLSFNNRQDLSNTSKEIQTMLRVAQTKARAGERPDGCARLRGHRVRIESTRALLQYVCDSPVQGIPHSAYTFPSGVTAINAATNIDYLTPYGGVTITSGASQFSDVEIVLTKSNIVGDTYSFTVTNQGEVTDQGFE